MGLFYSNKSKPALVGYSNAGYLLIHIKLSLKSVMYLHVAVLLYISRRTVRGMLWVWILEGRDRKS